MKKEIDFLHLFGNNGWVWHHQYEDWIDDKYYLFKASFLGTYQVDVYAVVSANKESFADYGGIGILWLECAGYPDCFRDANHGYTFSDLKDIISGMEKAEENLVRCGIPFVSDYHFRGPNKANLKRRNDATRRRLKVDELEKKWEEE